MDISGSIGYIKLKNNIKNIHIFLDNHSNNKYCNNSNQLFLHNFIEKYILNNPNFCIKKKCNINIFLEELIDENNMISLHKDSLLLMHNRANQPQAFRHEQSPE